VEYETLSWKKEEMMKIVLRNKKWKLKLRRDDGHLSAEKTELKEWRWKGTSKLGGQKWAHHGDGDTVEYVVVTDTWRFVEGALPVAKDQGSWTPIPESMMRHRTRGSPSSRVQNVQFLLD
jgi:hypothetical protein